MPNKLTFVYYFFFFVNSLSCLGSVIQFLRDLISHGARPLIIIELDYKGLEICSCTMVLVSVV